MARAQLTFRQTDLTRAVKATLAAGLDVAGVEIDKVGTIRVLVGKPQEAADEGKTEHNRWDRVL